MKKFLFSIFFAFISLGIFAQELHPVTWNFEVSPSQDGLSTKLIFKASIEEGWYLYAQDLEEGGPIPTQFFFDALPGVEFATFCQEESEFVVEKYDEMFAMDLKKFKHEVSFTQEIIIPSGQEQITGHLEFMCCDDMQCLAPEIVTFNFKIK